MKKPENFEEYCSGFPKATQKLLKQLRSCIKKSAPGAFEVISYGMPAFKLNGMLVYFAAYKNHIGFYPFRSAINTFRSELGDHITSMATVRLPHNQPLPLELISRMVKFRVAENLGRSDLKKTKLKVNRKKAAKPAEQEAVIEYMNKIKHPLKDGMQALRDIIKKSDPRICERIKWNAPSYYYLQDIVTFGPIRKNKILLVFHHPLIVNVKSTLLKGNYKDRRLAWFANLDEIMLHKKELTAILKKIIAGIAKSQHPPK